MNTEMQKILQAAKVIIDNGAAVGGTNVTEANSTAILAGILNLTIPTDDQFSLIKYLEGGTSTSVADTAPLPVKISSATGDINVTAGDLHVQLEHIGANFDSIRIGDGTNLLHINADGSVNTVIKSEDRLARYAISRTDDSTVDEYYGFIDVLGHWYIMKVATATGIFTYAKGVTDFLTNWGNRATTVVYDEFNNLTW